MAAIALERTFPHSTLQDHDDVRCALTVALAAFKRGDVDDASKWLRRASRAAADADDVMRAMELGKAAADFEQGSAEHRKVPTPPPSSGPPPRRVAPRRSSGPPPRYSGIAPRPPAKARRSSNPARPASVAPRSSGPPRATASTRPSVPRAARSSAPRSSGQRASASGSHDNLAPPPIPSFALREQVPPPVPSAAKTLPRRQHGSDLDPTRRRMPVGAIPPPAPDFELPSLMDDEEDCPTAVRGQAPKAVPSAPASAPISLVPDRSGSYPSSPHLERVSERALVEESLNEDTIREKIMLEPPATPDGGIPLSAARVAVMAQPGGPPEVRFLPFGARAPEGAVTAMLVTTNAHDAARLADMLVGA